MQTRYLVTPAGLDFTQVSVFRQADNGSQRTLFIRRIPSQRVPELVEELNARGITEFVPQ